MEKRQKKILIIEGLIISGLITGLIAAGCIEKITEEFFTPEIIEENATKIISNIRVAIVYESITDGTAVGPDRSIDDVINIINETNADLIFRGFWRWYPIPESPDDISPELLLYLAEVAKKDPVKVPELIRESGRNYLQLSESISRIIEKEPNIIFVGAIPAQRINRIDKNDITGTIYGQEETWKMALDPQKWGIKRNDIPMTKEDFQKEFSVSRGRMESSESYNPEESVAYVPDITNPDYQEILLSWAKRQIDAGANAIWIDGLPQTPFLYRITGDIKHRSISDSFEATVKIVDEIHKYGESKGTYIYVGSWAAPLAFVEGLPYLPPNIDFVTVTPSDEEIKTKTLNENHWNERLGNIRKLYGNIPIFIVIDWSEDKSPIVSFSQELSKEEQKEMLRTLDQFFDKMDAIFIYPVHGGHMGSSLVAKKLAYGKYGNYDSIAPEFETYETIKELAQNKS